jgi:hypothetical protein
LERERDYDVKIIQSAAEDLESLLQVPLKLPVLDKYELARALAPYIEKLLNQDFERLLQLCYKIDLGEEKLKSILHEEEADQIVDRLSLAIVERQLLKVYFRRKYSG